MLEQIALVLVAGLIETSLYTAYLILIGHKRLLPSSLLMTLYIFVYFWLLKYIIKDNDSWMLIAVYAISCGMGNYLSMKIDSDYKYARKWWKKNWRRLWKK